ncbi:hypothetical protein HDU76_002457 [Blyttiomyces sp. JEL0837]|nr:hypothetical protein HDU76_002457 [Blyttiomyces sp. JEL0837]
MVILSVKRNDELLFIYQTPVTTETNVALKEVVTLYNQKLRLKRLVDAVEDIKQHGVMKPESEHGYSVDELESLNLNDREDPKKGTIQEKNGFRYVHNPDPTGRRNGEAPLPEIVETIQKTIDNAKGLLAKEFPALGKFLTVDMIEEAIRLIDGALKIAYPMGLPEWEPTIDILKDEEDLTGTAASKEVIALADASMWWAGKEILPNKTLADFLGKNDKTKVIVKLQKKSQGAPVREPAIDEKAQKELMAYYYRKQEEHKIAIMEDDDNNFDSDEAGVEQPTEPAPAEEGVEPAAEAAAAEEPQDTIEDSSDVVQLTADVIAPHISLLARTGNGLSYAYTRLEIHGKNIRNIDILENYVHLRYIDLSDNSIKDIDALASMEYLLAIDFHLNNIKTIPASMDRRKYLQQANFSKNHITSIDVVSWPMLAWLNLNENKLTELKLQEFGELTHLEARGNKLKHTRGINARKLEKLYLAGNALTQVELEDKPHLQILHLRDNQINSLSGLTEGFKSLTTLNLRNNKIDNFDEVAKLAVLPALKSLTLSENPVDQLPNYRLEVLSRLPKLEKIDKEPVADEEREEAEQLKAQPKETVVADE